jgi:hypothetical protein
MLLRALVVWIVFVFLAILNGVFRESVLVPHTGEGSGRAISTLMLCVAILLITWLTIRWIGPAVPGQAVLVGGIWLVLTVAFEFGFGHYAAGKSWSELLADYNVFQGRIWVLVLLTTAIAPYLTARIRGLWT